MSHAFLIKTPFATNQINPGPTEEKEVNPLVLCGKLTLSSLIHAVLCFLVCRTLPIGTSEELFLILKKFNTSLLSK